MRDAYKVLGGKREGADGRTRLKWALTEAGWQFDWIQRRWGPVAGFRELRLVTTAHIIGGERLTRSETIRFLRQNSFAWFQLRKWNCRPSVRCATDNWRVTWRCLRTRMGPCRFAPLRGRYPQRPLIRTEVPTMPGECHYKNDNVKVMYALQPHNNVTCELNIIVVRYIQLQEVVTGCLMRSVSSSVFRTNQHNVSVSLGWD